jgi:hypothetical protein
VQDKRVGVTSVRGNVYPSGVGQIMIPYEVDRDSFVKDCLATGFVSIQPQENNPIHRVRCDKWVLQQIDFPSSYKELGSYVAYINMPKTKKPIVVACIDSIFEYGSIKENQFKLFKQTDLGSVSIVGDGKGALTISVSSEASRQGRVDINLSNPDNTTEFNIIANGAMSVTTTGKTSLLSNSEVDVQVTDGKEATSSFNITKDEIRQVSSSIKHNEGLEPMVLGNTILEKIDKILDLLVAAKVATTIGLQPLTNFAEFQALKGELEEFLSTKSTLE